MKDIRIEEQLQSAVKDMTPDMLDALTRELGLKEADPVADDTTADEPVDKANNIINFDKKRKRAKRIYGSIAGLAAALVIFLGGFNVLKDAGDPVAIVGLDVNPSIELSVDKKDRVVTARAYNDEGENILKDLDFEGSDINVACNAVVGAMLTRGYLTDLTNSILVSVQSSDEQHGKALEADLSKNLNGYLEDTKIAAAILGQYVKEDKALLTFAHDNKISTGKAWLIKSLATQNDRLTEDSLLKLSTQELILLGQEKKLKGDQLYGSVNTSEYITREEALRIGVENAGILGDSQMDDKSINDMLDWSRVEFECDDGLIIYNVDFTVNGVEYEYDLDAKTGKVLETDVESHVTPGSNSGGGGNSGGTNGGGGGTTSAPAATYVDDDDDYDDRYDDYDDQYDDRDDYDDRYDDRDDYDSDDDDGDDGDDD